MDMGEKWRDRQTKIERQTDRQTGVSAVGMGEKGVRQTSRQR